MNDDVRIRLDATCFSEILLMPDGSRREIMPLDRVERFLLAKDHEIALLMNELRDVRPYGAGNKP